MGRRCVSAEKRESPRSGSMWVDKLDCAKVSAGQQFQTHMLMGARQVA